MLGSKKNQDHLLRKLEKMERQQDFKGVTEKHPSVAVAASKHKELPTNDYADQQDAQYSKRNEGAIMAARQGAVAVLNEVSGSSIN